MTYPAKILLFGEHTILCSSRALATVFPRLHGQWEWGDGEQYRLKAFALYLAAQFDAPELDAQSFSTDLEQGLFFSSNIPTGYGLGSSGALCAAVFDRYATLLAKGLPAADLKAFFAQMERFFHGASSGADPLICYLQQSVCLLPEGGVQKLVLPALAAPYSFFLLDTGKSRETGSLVRYFLERYETDEVFRERTDSMWIPATEQAIDGCLSGDGDATWQAFDRISQFQLNELPPMVLPALRPIWKAGLAGDTFRLKICGAGGGGYCLGITKNWALTQQEILDWTLLQV